MRKSCASWHENNFHLTIFEVAGAQWMDTCASLYKAKQKVALSESSKADAVHMWCALPQRAKAWRKRSSTDLQTADVNECRSHSAIPLWWLTHSLIHSKESQLSGQRNTWVAKTQGRDTAWTWPSWPFVTVHPHPKTCQQYPTAESCQICMDCPTVVNCLSPVLHVLCCSKRFIVNPLLSRLSMSRA